jgi:hypothetical protein
MLTLEALDVKHSSFDKDMWEDLYALYRGGRLFRDRIHRFLPKNPMERPDIYEQRKSESSYRSYMGPIIDYYSAWLFSGDFKVRAKQAESGATLDEVDPKYAEFREDVGGDVDMKAFLKDRFTKALVHGRSHWICELPAATKYEVGQWPGSVAEYEESGLMSSTLRPVDACNLYDWEIGDDGRLAWCSTYSCREVRPSITDTKRTIVETWHVYDREFCNVYEIRYKKGERPRPEETIPPKVVYKHGFLQVPLVTLHIPDGMWIADRVSDPQKAHFRLGTALDWSIKRTCYAMPVFKLEDEEKPPVMGAGYYIMIGKEESMEWAAPPQGHFDVISKEVDVQRNDIFRMTNQMALGLDNNAETVGRSADSKDQDNAATRIMLNAYGSIVCGAIEETYELISDAWGDTETYWSIEGFNGYDTATPGEVIAIAQAAQLLNIPSLAYLVEIKSKAAISTIPEASQDVKDLIRKQIAEGVTTNSDMMDLLSAGYTSLQNRQSIKDVKDLASQKTASKPPPV